MDPRILRTPQAAIYIGLSASALEKMRLSGAGPRFVRLGQKAVGYDVRDLDAWVQERRQRGALDHPDHDATLG